jgi:hypothetical protein
MTSLILIYTIITQRGIFQLLAIVNCETSETLQNVCLLTISNIKIFKKQQKSGGKQNSGRKCCVSQLYHLRYTLFRFVLSLL